MIAIRNIRAAASNTSMVSPMKVMGRSIVNHRTLSQLSNVNNKARSYTALSNLRLGVSTWNHTKQQGSYLNQYRNYSVISEECKAKPYDYKKVKEWVKNPSSDVMLVDVREPVEFQEGHIPGAVNIPFKSNPGALGLSEEEFEESFDFPKPDPNKELVFYCLAGIRSTAAEDLARTFGYKKRGNYVGSYEDWVANEIQKGQSKSQDRSPNPSSNA